MGVIKKNWGMVFVENIPIIYSNEFSTNWFDGISTIVYCTEKKFIYLNEKLKNSTQIFVFRISIYDYRMNNLLYWFLLKDRSSPYKFHPFLFLYVLIIIWNFSLSIQFRCRLYIQPSGFNINPITRTIHYSIALMCINSK